MVVVAKLKVVVGTPGTGKSYQLIQKAVDCENEGKSYSVIVPTNVAKKRILSGLRKSVNLKELNIDQYYDAMVNVHVLQYNYHGEQNVFIDEFSMFNIDDFYSLLYKVMLAKNEVSIMAFGDSKQLQPVYGISPLLVLLRFNYGKFVDIENMPFSEYSATRLYQNLKDMKLDVPDNWKLAIDSIDLKVLHNNYRLKRIDGVTDYNDSFYRYILNNNLIDKNYEDNLVRFAKEKYLIITPTHDLGDKADKIISEGLFEHDGEYDTKSLSKFAPFVRNRENKEVYSNPLCKVNYGFDDFIPFCDKDYKLKKNNFEFSFYVTSHATQGATVDNMVFYLGDKDIDKDKRDFYTNNMLYTALSRARYNSIFLGTEAAFLKMANTFIVSDLSFMNSQLQEEALDLTYQAIVNSENFNGRFSNKDIINLYNKTFKKVVKNNDKKVKDINLVDPKFEIKPYSPKMILSVMKINSGTKLARKYRQDLLRLGYGFHWEKYISDQAKIGGSLGGVVGGKSSLTNNWIKKLSSDQRKNMKEDLKILSTRKFLNKYNHKKQTVEKYFD